MISQRFTYPILYRRDSENGRVYETPDGNRLPSVTTILSKTKPQETTDALDNWRKNVGQTRAKEITAESSGRGTRVHKYLEDFVKHDKMTPPGSNPFSIQGHDMAAAIVGQGLVNVSEYWGTEVSLYYPEIYSGTTDLIAVHNGEPAIIDFKQSNRTKKREWISDYFIQLASYAAMHNVLFGTTIRKGVIMMCTPNLEYQEFIIEGDEFDSFNDQWWDRVEKYYRSILA